MKKSALVSIQATEEHLIRAQSIDQDYLISVAFPYHYDDRPNDRYPVIYVLDGNWYFGLVVDMVRVMNFRVPFCNELPDAIIVGIGYPEGNSLTEKQHEICQRRMRDFTSIRDEGLEAWHHSEFPIPSEGKRAGGAAAFLTFLESQLIPYVDAHYRTDTSNRCLLGHSLGGTFALYSAFNCPTLFQKYVVASPAQTFMGEAWFTEAQTYTELPARMFLSVGELEYDENAQAQYQRLIHFLNDRLTNRNTLVERTFANYTHCAVVAPSFQVGLVAVLP